MQIAANHSYEQVLTYEVARDLLNTYVADCSAEIGVEREKPAPSLARIKKLQEKQREIILEREAMDLTDDASMRELLAKYRRPPITAAKQA